MKRYIKDGEKVRRKSVHNDSLHRNSIQAVEQPSSLN
jgi:hypothetical protein